MNLSYLRQNKASLLLCVLSLILSQFGFSQEYEYADYTWDSIPESVELTAEELQKSTITLQEESAIEYAYNDYDNLVAYKFYHRMRQVNSDEGIEMNNRIYIPTSNTTVFEQLKARVIRDGKVISVLGEEDVITAKDEDSGTNYEYFALEGLEKGSIIEFYYIIKYNPSYTGRNIKVQSDEIKKEYLLKLISPAALGFAYKCYGGLEEMEVDTTLENKHVFVLDLKDIPALEDDETMSAYATNLKQLIFKLDENFNTNYKGIISFGPVASNTYESVYVKDKSDKKIITKILKGIEGLNDEMPLELQILHIENYLKQAYTIIDYNDDRLKQLPFIYENKSCSDFGMTRLLANIFDRLDIKHELVIGCDRYEYKFDPDFEVYNFLGEYLIHFPDVKKFIEPGSQFGRLGFINQKLMHNNALFIKTIEIGDVKTAVGKVKFIDAIASEYNKDNLNIDIELDIENAETKIMVTRELFGYNAINYQPFYDLMKEEGQKELNESLIHFVSNKPDIQDVAIQNTGFDNVGLKPLLVNGTVVTAQFVEKAGPKYVLKIGQMIGPQMEMYQEDTREQPIMNHFNREYHRIINFTIPDGYLATNLDKLVLNVTDKDKEPQAGFVSSYTVQDGVLSIDIVEYYHQIEYPASDYDRFRAVINAAADFNKAVLYLEKE